jgi:antitoxin CptB
MDLILGPWFDREGERMSDAELDHYEALLDENDQALYAWVSGREEPPAEFAELVGRLVP